MPTKTLHATPDDSGAVRCVMMSVFTMPGAACKKVVCLSLSAKYSNARARHSDGVDHECEHGVVLLETEVFITHGFLRTRR